MKIIWREFKPKLRKKKCSHNLIHPERQVSSSEPKRQRNPLSAAAAPHKSVLVGDLKLADSSSSSPPRVLRWNLLVGLCGVVNMQHYTRFVIQLRRVVVLVLISKLLLKVLCEDYNKIREYLYSQFYLI
ncbi:hypothetical protein QN277_011972 [Acacia crassicarpa]|uniref:Uncharacterized protein n=1 Tax=Acacia crassicarpa TaxID=499986 RepID=A0AAE1TCC7_9FABA|nr:hypothetical protein QN277_011972 [Acacia crassicarpa]